MSTHKTTPEGLIPVVPMTDDQGEPIVLDGLDGNDEIETTLQTNKISKDGQVTVDHKHSDGICDLQINLKADVKVIETGLKEAQEAVDRVTEQATTPLPNSGIPQAVIKQRSYTTAMMAAMAIRSMNRDMVRTPLAEPVLPKQATTRTGRNQPCTCGSGKKYKKCCISQGKAKHI